MRAIFGSAFVAFLLSLTACASGPEWAADTPSGYPEVSIYGSNLAAVKQELLNRMQDNGYFLIDESRFRMLYARSAEQSGGNLFALTSVGNPFSSGRKVEIAYTLSMDDNEVRLIAFPTFSDVDYRTGSRYYYAEDPRLFNQSQVFLTDLKQDLEAR